MWRGSYVLGPTAGKQARPVEAPDVGLRATRRAEEAIVTRHFESRWDGSKARRRGQSRREGERGRDVSPRATGRDGDIVTTTFVQLTVLHWGVFLWSPLQVGVEKATSKVRTEGGRDSGAFADADYYCTIVFATDSCLHL